MKHVLLAVLLGACTASTYGGGGAYPSSPGSMVSGAASDTAIAALSCTRDAAGAHFATAAPLKAGVSAGCVDGAEVDVYAVTAPETANAGVLYEVALMASEHACAKLYDQDRTAHGSSDCADETKQASMWFAIAPGTTAYIRIERTHQSPTPYRLDVVEHVLQDRDEPANGWKSAVPLELDTKHNALLHVVMNDATIERDVYRVAVPANGTLGITIDPSSDDVQARIELYDADRALVASVDADNRGAIARLAESIKAGTYYVQVAEVYADPWGIGDDKPGTAYAKPYSIEVKVDGKRRR